MKDLIDKGKFYFEKYREVITYLFFGGLTTVVSFVAYYCLTRFAGLPEGASTNISNVIGILFAYVTNKIWVFQSKTEGFAALAKEFASFFSARLVSMLIGYLIMKAGVALRVNDLVAYVFMQVFVIVFNYFASKLVIFKKKKSAQPNEKDGSAS